jgi:sterol 3beta-glucosyltransferase
MRIAIVTFGSRGDVQPYIALGLGLQAARHAVRLAAYGIYAQFVKSHGLEFAPVVGDPERGFGIDGQGDPRIGRWREFLSLLLAPRFFADCLEACRDADVIVASGSGALVAYHVAEKLELPLVLATYAPPRGMTRPATLVFGIRRQLFWLRFRPATNRARREALGLPALPFREPFGRAEREHLVLCGFSPSVVPRRPEWPASVHVTGYWFLDHAPDWQPPADLVRFLEAGRAPVYVGFAGGLDDDPVATTRLILEALRRVEQRGVVWAPAGVRGALDVSDTVYLVDDVPFDWLFPRCEAVVHHGGAGTTAAGLRAGRPSVLVPTFADQPIWAQRVYELGVGPEPLPHRRLSVDRLVAAIRAATTDARLRANATALGDRVRTEDGVARAVQTFEQHLLPASRM